MAELEHKFYLKTEKEQKRLQLKLAVIVIILNLVLLCILFLIGMPFLSFIFISITLSIIAPFFDTPSLIKRGQLIYHSPLFLTEKEKNGMITIHGGTLFDYYFVIDRNLNGQQRTNLIIKSYLDGLLQLIEQYETTMPNSIKLYYQRTNCSEDWFEKSRNKFLAKFNPRI